MTRQLDSDFVAAALGALVGLLLALGRCVQG